jgi:hypothetical protein
VWRCPHPDAVHLREAELRKLDTWLTDQKTDPDLQRLILIRLFDWLESQPFTSISPRSTLYYDLLQQQDAIGWELPFTGMWPNTWAPAQTLYYNSIESSKSGKKWLERLTVKIWMIAWNLWRQRCEWLDTRKADLAHDTVVAQIQALYRQPRDCYPPSLRRRMIPLEQLLQKSIPQLEAWYTAFQTYAAIGYCRQDNPLQNLRRLGRSLGVTPHLPPGTSYVQAWTVLSRLLHQNHPASLPRSTQP